MLFQFKISCSKSNPRFGGGFRCRTALSPSFSHYIQAAFGWTNSHLHQFEIDGKHYSQGLPDGGFVDLDFENESKVKLSQLLANAEKKTRWIYEYDFGDSWRHEILFEGNPGAVPKVKYPQCVDGKRACPPEDVGGPWGYPDYLEAIANPKHPEHEEQLEWAAPSIPSNSTRRKRRKKCSR